MSRGALFTRLVKGREGGRGEGEIREERKRKTRTATTLTLAALAGAEAQGPVTGGMKLAVRHMDQYNKLKAINTAQRPTRDDPGHARASPSELRNLVIWNLIHLLPLRTTPSTPYQCLVSSCKGPCSSPPWGDLSVRPSLLFFMPHTSVLCFSDDICIPPHHVRSR